MRPLFAIAPLAFALAFFSPSPAKLSASVDAFLASFGGGTQPPAETPAK